MLRARPVPKRTTDASDASFGVLVRMVDLGADLQAVDSYGNSALHRAVLDAVQVLPSRDPGAPLDEQFTRNLSRIFDLLLDHGQDPQRVEPVLGHSLVEHYGADLVGSFLRSGS
ncbi:hypothetical protein ACQB6R_03785 [Propionibacteriaceae bacterium G1746]